MQPQQPAGWVPQNGMSMSMPYPQLQLSQQQQQLSQHQQQQPWQLPASQQQQYPQQQQQQQLPMYGQDQSCGQAKPSKKKKKKTQQQQQQQQQHNGMQETQTVPGDGDTSSSHTNAMGMTSRALSLAGSEHARPSQAFQQLLGLQGFSPSQLMMQQHPHGMPPHPLQQNAPATSHAQQQQQQLQLMQSPSLQLQQQQPQQQASSQGQQQELLRQQLMQRLVSQAHMLSQLPSGKPPAPNTDSRKDRKPRPECPVCGGPGRHTSTRLCSTCYGGVYNDIAKVCRDSKECLSLDDFVNALKALPRGCPRENECLPEHYSHHLPTYVKCTQCRTLAVVKHDPHTVLNLLNKRWRRQRPNGGDAKAGAVSEAKESLSSRTEAARAAEPKEEANKGDRDDAEGQRYLKNQKNGEQSEDDEGEEEGASQPQLKRSKVSGTNGSNNK